jgi:hypothetical protein
MKSDTLPSFWEGYRKLDESIRRKARKNYVVWLANPFHPSLRFKCVNHSEDIWSVRITRSYRALGVMENDGVTWFWIGNHDEYERYFG